MTLSKLFLDDDADTVRRPDITVENPAWRKTMGYQKPGGGRENRDFDPHLIVTTEMLPRYRPGGMAL